MHPSRIVILRRPAVLLGAWVILIYALMGGFWAVSLGQAALPLSTLLPGCAGTIHVTSPLLTPAVVDAAGGATFTLSMPGSAGLCGQVVAGQYVELSAGACPVFLGDALAYTIGN